MGPTSARALGPTEPAAISSYEPQPAYQIGKVNGANSTNRTNPDVSMDADPNTGVFVVDSFLTGSTSTFLQVGGTSLATPMWAGLIALADQVRAQRRTVDAGWPNANIAAPLQPPQQ